MTIALLIIVVLILVFGFVVFFGAPYVPSQKKYVRAAFEEVYVLTKNDLLVDIGSGDGVVLREASRLGARAVGVELNPILVLLSRALSRGDPKVHTYFGNLWHFTFPNETTIVYLFGESRDITRMVSKIQTESHRLQKPLLAMSYGFELPGLTQIGQHGAHFLYTVSPLQQEKAQV